MLGACKISICSASFVFKFGGIISSSISNRFVSLKLENACLTWLLKPNHTQTLQDLRFRARRAIVASTDHPTRPLVLRALVPGCGQHETSNLLVVQKVEALVSADIEGILKPLRIFTA